MEHALGGRSCNAAHTTRIQTARIRELTARICDPKIRLRVSDFAW
jgi:hypothetical protein